jgi:undecaprenyl pyrophosphate phosphatase UppP
MKPCDSPKIFLQIGACLCILIGVLYGAGAADLLVDGAFYKGDALVTIFMIIYALLAFVPFAVFVYPTLKTSRKPVFLSAGILEILVMGGFVWWFLNALKD